MYLSLWYHTECFHCPKRHLFCLKPVFLLTPIPLVPILSNSNKAFYIREIIKAIKNSFHVPRPNLKTYLPSHSSLLLPCYKEKTPSHCLCQTLPFRIHSSTFSRTLLRENSHSCFYNLSVYPGFFPLAFKHQISCTVKINFKNLSFTLHFSSDSSPLFTKKPSW